LADVIYKPNGPAREYAALALNLYSGCTHGCTYCYAPGALHMRRSDFHGEPRPKMDIVSRVRYNAIRLARLDHTPEILLSFIGDVYQPAEVEHQITRSVIKILIEHGFSFTILTKGGKRAARDFDLLKHYPGFRFGTSLSVFSQKYADRYEPNAATVEDRIDTIALAKSMGIETWVSLEPVIMPDQAIRIINLIHELVDHWAVGKINHHKDKGVDWGAFAEDVECTLKDVRAYYYIKSSLKDHGAS